MAITPNPKHKQVVPIFVALSGVFVSIIASSCGRVNVEASAGRDPEIQQRAQALLGGAFWSMSVGGRGDHSATDVAANANGGAIVTGVFTGSGASLDVGPDCQPLTSLGDNTGYVANVNSSGACLWAKTFGQGVLATAVAVDVNRSNLWLTGDFNGSIDFGCGELRSDGGTHAFLVKSNLEGTCIEARQFGETFSQSNGIAIDSAGNVIIVGEFAGRVDFGVGEGGLTSHEGPGSDVFVAKFSNEFRYQWAHAYGESATQAAKSVATYSSNIVVTGWHRGPIDFGGGRLLNSDGASMFLVQLNGDGTHRWSRTFGGTRDHLPAAVKLDDDGNAIVTGAFDGAFNTLGGPCREIVSNGSFDVFLAKFSPNGSCLWRNGYGDANHQAGTSVAIGPMGSIFLTGYTSGAFAFGRDAPLLHTQGIDVFLAKSDASGLSFGSTLYRSASDPSAATQQGLALAFHPASNALFMVGFFGGVLDFGGPPLIRNGGLDGFLVKFDNACDASNCNGCCDGNTCRAPSTSYCGTGGRACNSCGLGQRCDTGEGQGTCVCDSASCTDGCCQSRYGACRVRDMAACGIGGGVCSIVCNSTLSNNCTSGQCKCGTEHAECQAGQRCDPNGDQGRGLCICDGSSCSSGCCDANNVCRSGTEATACGPQGGRCVVCTPDSVCLDRACRCPASMCGVPGSCHTCSCEEGGPCSCPCGGTYPNCATCSCPCGGTYPECWACPDPSCSNCLCGCGPGFVCRPCDYQR